MDRKTFKTLMRSIKELDESKQTYPDYSDISIMFRINGRDTTFSLPNKTEKGVVKTYTMVGREELIEAGVEENYLSKLEENYDIMQTNSNRKYKLFQIKGKKKIEFTLKSNVRYKEYSDGITIINDLRKNHRLITMNKLIKYSNEYISECYFNFKYLIKLRAIVASGKKKSVGKTFYKGNKPIKEIFLEKKDLGKIRRIDLCRYNIKDKE